MPGLDVAAVPPPSPLRPPFRWTPPTTLLSSSVQSMNKCPPHPAEAEDEWLCWHWCGHVDLSGFWHKIVQWFDIIQLESLPPSGVLTMTWFFLPSLLPICFNYTIWFCGEQNFSWRLASSLYSQLTWFVSGRAVSRWQRKEITRLEFFSAISQFYSDGWPTELTKDRGKKKNKNRHFNSLRLKCVYFLAKLRSSSDPVIMHSSSRSRHDSQRLSNQKESQWFHFGPLK